MSKQSGFSFVPVQTSVPRGGDDEGDDQVLHSTLWFVQQHKARLEKWNLAPELHLARFRYHEQLDLTSSEQVGQFLCELFNTDMFQSRIVALGGDVAKVEFTKQAATWCTLHVLQRVVEVGAVSSTGAIRQCLEDEVDGVKVADELRKVLLVEDSECFEDFSVEDRRELLFRLLVHICVGGPLCQYEDTYAPIKEVTRDLYKTLVHARKDENTGKVRIASEVFSVHAVDAAKPLFPQAQHPRNLCLVSVHPFVREVTVYHFAWRPFW